jgi:hypothetical protein
MAAEAFTILHKGLKLEEIVGQVRAIDKYPAVIHIYGMVFMLRNKDEASTLAIGIEIGWDTHEESLET